MDTVESLNQSAWDCKYHVVFIPECRRKALYGDLRQYLGEVFRRPQQKESRIEEGHLLSDHVHMLIAMLPKYAVAQVVGFIKGKSVIHMARVYGERKRNLVGQHFWARGYSRPRSVEMRAYPRLHSEAGTRGRAPGPNGGSGAEGPPRRWPITVGATSATRQNAKGRSAKTAGRFAI